VPHVTEIRISEEYRGLKRPLMKIQETLIHETLHGIDYHYCGLSIDHEIIHLTDKIWLQIFADNDFTLSTMRKLPKAVKIGGFIYDIIFPYIFKDDDGCNSVSFEELKVFIGDSDNSGKFSFEFVKTLFVESLTAIVMYHCDTGEDECLCDYKLISQIGRGMYQVLTDNKIEVFVRKCYRQVKKCVEVG
jgi:hypothetical protein